MFVEQYEAIFPSATTGLQVEVRKSCYTDASEVVNSLNAKSVGKDSRDVEGYIPPVSKAPALH